MTNSPARVPPVEPLLEAVPSHAVWITTQYGDGRSINSASRWFAKAADHLPGYKTAHGLRKLVIAEMAVNGATSAQRQSWAGHLTPDENDWYIRQVERRRIIEAAQFPTRIQNLEKLGANTLFYNEIF